MNLRLQRLFARLYRKPLDGEGGDDSGGGAPGGDDSLSDLVGAVGESDDAGGDEGDEGDDAGGDEGDPNGDIDLDDPADRRPKRDAANPDGDEGEPSDPDDAEVSWQDGDKPIKAKMSELRTAYKAKSDYEARLPEVTARETHATTLATTAQQRLQEGAQIVNNVLKFMHAQLEANKPDMALLDSNPTEYVRRQAIYAEKQQVFNQMVQARDAVGAGVPGLSDEQKQARLLTEQSRLYEAKPEWRNTAVRAAELGKVSKALQAVGFTAEEIQSMTDHRAILIAHDAHKWRELQALKANKGAPAKKPTQSVKPGAAAPANAPKINQVQRNATARLRTNPNDFNALASLIG